MKADLSPQISCLIMCEMLEYKECGGCISVNFLRCKKFIDLIYTSQLCSNLEMESKYLAKSDALEKSTRIINAEQFCIMFLTNFCKNNWKVIQGVK